MKLPAQRDSGANSSVACKQALLFAGATWCTCAVLFVTRVCIWQGVCCDSHAGSTMPSGLR